MSSFYEPGWLSGHPQGEVPWAESWIKGNQAQQIKGTGAADAEYSQRYESLSKGDSDVDDDGAWRTVTSLDNRKAGTREEMQRLAEEWRSKGFDVRVQDLDSEYGDWADLAVRKGQGQGQAQEPTVVQPRERLLEARSEWDKDQTDAARGEAAIPFIPTGDGVGDAADYGNKTGEWYAKRFVPSLNRQAALEAEEMGQSGAFNLARFVGDVPQLGDAKEAFEYYSDQIG
jgi:hypothetical protein